MVQGQVFLRGGRGAGGAGGLALFLFNFFKFYHFIIFKFRITLTFAKFVMHLKKKYFFRHHNFKKKGHSKLSKNEPENLP